MKTNKLKIITSDTCKKLRTKDIVLPSHYLDTFNAVAKEHNLDTADQGQISRELEKDINRVHEIIHQTSTDLDLFAKTTQNAKQAMKDSDDKSLDECIVDVEALQKNLYKLKLELYTDQLTGAFNRRWINESFLKNSDIFSEKGTLIFIDIDHFKDINDTFGHLVGDSVLKFFITLSKSFFIKKSVDIIRYAGDEFLFISHEHSSIEMTKQMAKLQNSLSHKTLKTADLKEIKFNFSYGLKAYKNGDNFNDIFELADKKMYSMKNR